jgi:dynein heavy chain
LDEPRIKAISVFLDNPEFQPQMIKTKINLVAGNLANWVVAQRKLYEVNLVVRPKMAQLAEAKEAFNKVDAILKVKQAELKQVVDRVNALERQLN